MRRKGTVFEGISKLATLWGGGACFKFDRTVRRALWAAGNAFGPGKGAALKALKGRPRKASPRSPNEWLTEGQRCPATPHWGF